MPSRLPTGDLVIQQWIDGGELPRARRALAARLRVNADDAQALFLRGATWLREGKTHRAEADFARAAALKPRSAEIRNAWAALLLVQGKARQALDITAPALARRGADAIEVVLLSNHVAALVALKRYGEALELARTLSQRDPDRLQTRSLVGAVLRGVGRQAEAVSWFEAALEMSGDDEPGLRVDIATCVQALGQREAADQILAPLLARDATDPWFYSSLGIRAQEAASPVVALKFFKRGQALFPDDLNLLVNLGITVQAMGNPGEGLFYLERALKVDKTCAPAWHFAGLSHASLHKREQAVKAFETCLKHDPKYVAALTHLAYHRKDKGKLDEAKALLRQAIAIDPDEEQPYLNLMGYLQDGGEFDEADALLKQARKRGLESQALRQAQASLMLKQGNITGANKLYRAILAEQPENSDASSGLLFCSNYDPDLTPEQLAQAYRLWDQRFTRWRAPPVGYRYPNRADPDRRLKIGYVSGDFRQHSVAFFSEPLLANHDHRQFEIYCYANQKGGDATTQRMMAMADHWRWTIDLSDDALTEMIRLDGIDILIDLSNHTAYHRLYLFGRKPAPIQATTLGMPTTTGLSAIDWRITDEWMDPPGLTEALHAEKLMRIASGWCYRPPEDAAPLPVSPLPATSNGHLSFASFNAFGKINPKVLRLWGRLLRAIPDAILYVATGSKDGDPVVEAQVRKTCKASGLPLDRLRIIGRKPFKPYFEFHANVDIVLDSFPYTGATVTAHALWMGVPVITLSGPSPIHRSATSMMTAVGHPEFIASTPDEYLRIAKRWARDIEGLARLRQQLRERMKASPLMDGAAVTKSLESHLREAWREWCRSAPARRPASSTRRPRKSVQPATEASPS